MKIIKNANDLEKVVEQEGILNNAKEIEKYYHESDNSIGILYKAKLEFLKDNFDKAKDIIINDYIPLVGKTNYTHYFLTLCYIEMKKYKLAYNSFTKINPKEKMNLSIEEYNGLRTYLEKKNDLEITEDDGQYLTSQIKEYSNNNLISKNYIKNPGTKFLIEPNILKSIIHKVENKISIAKKVKTLDIYDKYYFYYKNIGIENTFPVNVFIVKTLKESKKILYIEPCIPKKTTLINDYNNLVSGKYNDSIGDDLENEIELNGLIANSSTINWLFKKYPYIKSIALYKVKLECALGNNIEAIKIIKEDYLPTFGPDNKIFFILIDLYCNVGKNLDAYNLLKINNSSEIMDDLVKNKYRNYQFMLEGILGILNTELMPRNYLENQLCKYDLSAAVNHVKEYSDSEDSTYEFILNPIYEGDLELFMSDIRQDILPELTQGAYVKEKKLNAKKTYKNDVLDSYYFYHPFIGRNKETGEYTDCLCIQTKKNTDEIISMFPVTRKRWYIINDDVEKEKGNTFK